MYHYTAPSAICNQIYIKQLFNIVFVSFLKASCYAVTYVQFTVCILSVQRDAVVLSNICVSLQRIMGPSVYICVSIFASWPPVYICVILFVSYHVSVSVHLCQYLCSVSCGHQCTFVNLCVVSCDLKCTFWLCLRAFAAPQSYSYS